MNTKEIAELDLGSLLQFDLLKKVIEHFIKEQKTLSQKISHIDERARKENNKATKAINALQSQINKLSSSPNIKDDNQIINPNTIQDNNDNNNNNNTIISMSSPLNKNKIMKPNSNITNDDNLLSEIESINITSNRDINLKKDTHPSLILDQNSLIEDIDKKVNDLTVIVDELKIQISEFNIYDAFKVSGAQGEGEGKVEIDLVLVKALETKVFSKFTQLEDKIKLTDQTLVKIKVDLSNTTNKSDSAYRTAFQQKEQLEQYINDNNQAIEDLKTEFKIMKEEADEEMNTLIQKTKNELINVIEERSSSKNISSTQPMKIKGAITVPSIPQEALNEMQNELKLMINKSISDSERYVKGMISELGVDSIRKDISVLQKGIVNKLERKDLQDIFLKFDDYNSIIQFMKDEMENMKGNIKNNAQLIEKLLKRSEFLTNLIYSKQSVNQDQGSSANMKLPPIDFTKYATQTQLSQLQTTLQSENDKVAQRADELKRMIELNEDQHKFFANEKDLRNMEQCIMNELDDYKLNAIKRFSDKLETQKNFRFIDLQIKHFAGSTKDKDGTKNNNDNWLIAKKPVGMYQCASCESILGDLNVKNDYIPWNRIQSKEDSKKYRV